MQERSKAFLFCPQRMRWKGRKQLTCLAQVLNEHPSNWYESPSLSFPLSSEKGWGKASLLPKRPEILTTIYTKHNECIFLIILKTTFSFSHEELVVLLRRVYAAWNGPWYPRCFLISNTFLKIGRLLIFTSVIWHPKFVPRDIEASSSAVTFCWSPCCVPDALEDWCGIITVGRHWKDILEA